MQNVMARLSFTKAIFSGLAAVAGVSGLAGSAAGATVIVNFGYNFTGMTDSSGRYYTSVASTGNGPFALNNTANASSGYSLTVTNPPGTAFNTTSATPYTAGFNTFNFGGGTNAPTGQAAALGYSGLVTQDSGYGNSTYFNNGNSNNSVPQVLLTLTGLSSTQQYGFDLFASRLGVTDNRIADYTITGGSSGTAQTTLALNTSNNSGGVVAASGFTPNSSGNITILLDADPSNNNSNSFYYLSVLQINSSPVPEPVSASAFGLGAVALLGRRRRVAGAPA